MSWLARIVIGVVVALVGLAATWFAGMRGKWRPVIDFQRRVNRTVFNPMQMRKAGTPGAYAGIIHHVGRRSGTPYATPMVACPTDGGFVIALPYGSRSDWVRNVLAAGKATIDHEGASYDVIDPQVVPIGDAPVEFPESEQRAHRNFAVAECLVVRTVA